MKRHGTLDTIITDSVNEYSVSMIADNIISELVEESKNQYSRLHEHRIDGISLSGLGTRSYFVEMLAFNEPVSEYLKTWLNDNGKRERYEGCDIFHTKRGDFAFVEDENEGYPLKDNWIYIKK